MKQKHTNWFFTIIVAIALFSSCVENNTPQMVPAYVDGKWGYVNSNGEYVISPRYKEAGFFFEDLALVKDDNGSYGYIDKAAQYVIAPKYKFGTSFHEGKAIVVEAGEYPICIDKKGNTVLQLQNIKELYNFKEGLAAFQDTSNMYGFINEKGNIVIAPTFEAVYEGFNGNHAPVKRNGKWGFVDKNGNFSISEYCYVASDYYDASEFVQKFAEKVTESTFDGFNASSTVQTIADSKVYGDYANAIDSTTIIALNIQKFTKDIQCIVTEFSFDNRIVSLDSLDNKTIVYDLTEPIASFGYKFFLSGQATNKGCAIAKRLSNEIASKLGVEKQQEEGLFYAIQENGKCSFVVLYNDTTVSLAVSYSQKNIENLIEHIRKDQPKYVKDFVYVDSLEGEK
ncbi:MAG: WG repeat-containing protein [Bacteroidales bacterium]|nr:WG repeat-containing protein [Bacteroidales bacterium]